MMNLVGSSTQNRMHLDHQALPSPHSCPSSTPSWSSWPPSSFAFRTTVHVQPDHQALPLLRSCPCSTPSLTAALSPSCPSHQSTGFRLTQVVWEKYLSIMELFMDFFYFHASTSLHVRVWATETCWVMTWPTAASSSSTSSAQCPSGRNFYIKTKKEKKDLIQLFLQAKHSEGVGLCTFQGCKQAGWIHVEPWPQQIQVELGWPSQDGAEMKIVTVNV